MSGFRINTNIAALSAMRNLGSLDRAHTKSMEKLSSGLRINRAADDAAGLAVSERIRTQVNGINQGVKNLQDGISLLQVAEGGISTIGDMVQRIRTLAVQSANDTLTDSDRSLIQKEVDQLLTEVDRQASTTTFNGKRLLDGSFSPTGKAVAESTVVAENVFDISATSPGNERTPDVSPDGSQVVYLDGITGRMAIKPIGGGAKTLIATPGGFSNISAPRFSPDGTKVAFRADSGGVRDIYTIAVGGGPVTNVTGGTGFNDTPSWSPDGTRIAYVHNAGTPEVHVTNADGSGADLFLQNKAVDPDVSPDSSRVAYLDNFGVANTRTTEPVGGGATTVVGGDGRTLRYSPDGSLIMFRLFGGAGQDIMFQNADGSGPIVNLTSSFAGTDEEPDWGADMRRFVFASTRSVTEDIHSANTRLFFDLAQPVEDPSTLQVRKNGVLLTLGTDYTLDDADSIRFTTTGIPAVGDTIDVSHTLLPKSLFIQAGANKGDTISISLPDARQTALGLTGLSVATRTGAENAITTVSNALTRINGSRAEIGAYQNRMENSMNFETTQVQNQAASESRIRDLDFSEEILNFTKQQILQQAGVSALAQANVAPQAVLQLLK